MAKKYLAYVLVLTFFGGVIGPIGVALADHKWHLPVDQFLPGASALFLPPLVLAALAFLVITARYRQFVGFGIKAAALGLSIPSAIAGLLASIPLLCLIAGQCL